MKKTKSILSSLSSSSALRTSSCLSWHFAFVQFAIVSIAVNLPLSGNCDAFVSAFLFPVTKSIAQVQFFSSPSYYSAFVAVKIAEKRNGELYRKYDSSFLHFSLDSGSGDAIVRDETALENTITGNSSSQLSASSSPSMTVNAATLRFNNKLNRMAKNFDGTTAPKVEALLLEALQNQRDEDNKNSKRISHKKSRNKSNDNKVIPNTISFTNAITAWARCTRKDSAKRAQSLLDKMHALYAEGNVHVKPNKISYNSVITAWSRSSERGAAFKTEELLRSMYDFYSEGGGDDVKPDSRSFNAVINAVARSREKNCADRAKFLLDEMGRLYNEGDEELLPDALTFGAIINAYANSLEEGASDKAAQLLMHMESLYQMGFDNAKPTTFVYNACMNAFAKAPLIAQSMSSNATSPSLSTSPLPSSFFSSSSSSGMIGGSAGQRTEPTQIDDQNKGVVLEATKSDKFLMGQKDNIPTGATAAEKAEQLLSSMEKRFAKEKDDRVKPDCISYSTVINAHANSKTPNAGHNADALLRRMTNRYLLGDDDCKPNAIAFTATIKAHSSAINATIKMIEESDGEIQTQRHAMAERIQTHANRSEELLQQLCMLYLAGKRNRSLKPTNVTFDLVVGSFKQAWDTQGAQRVKVLREQIYGGL